MPETLSFFQQVYAVVRLIPPGRITTYGAIAAFLGSPGAARMVGWAMNASHGASPWVPAHRVVNRSGVLSGKHHFGGQHIMKQLLESEGIVVDNDQVLEFDRLFWDPANLAGNIKSIIFTQT